MDATTEAMEFALRQYATTTTFGGYDPTAAMLAGAQSDEWLRGIKLAATMQVDARARIVQLRYAA